MGARRSSREDVALHPELAHLAPKTGEFLALGRAQGRFSRSGGLHLPAALLTLGLGDPVADRLGGGLELTSQVGRIASGAG
jgi:hypothetical protein